ERRPSRGAPPRHRSPRLPVRTSPAGCRSSIGRQRLYREMCSRVVTVFPAGCPVLRHEPLFNRPIPRLLISHRRRLLEIRRQAARDRPIMLGRHEVYSDVVVYQHLERPPSRLHPQLVPDLLFDNNLALWAHAMRHDNTSQRSARLTTGMILLSKTVGITL